MGRKTRIKACELAAEVMAGRPDDKLTPTAWSLAVFFERYIDLGARRTRLDFGPKKARALRLVR